MEIADLIADDGTLTLAKVHRTADRIAAIEALYGLMGIVFAGDTATLNAVLARMEMRPATACPGAHPLYVPPAG